MYSVQSDEVGPHGRDREAKRDGEGLNFARKAKRKQGGVLVWETATTPLLSPSSLNVFSTSILIDMAVIVGR